MEYLKFKSLLRRVIVIPMVVTAVLAALLLWESFDLNRSLQWVDYTDQVIDQSARLLKLFVDVETGMRGYLATGDEALLQPYLGGTQRFDSEYRALYKLVDDSSPQKQRLEDSFSEFWRDRSDSLERVMSRAIVDAPTTPSPSQIGDMVSDTVSKWPSLATRVVSNWSTFWPLLSRPNMSVSSPRRSVGCKTETDFPMISAAW